MGAEVLDCVLIGWAIMAMSGIINGYGEFARSWA